jgi:hypothetical protein
LVKWSCISINFVQLLLFEAGRWTDLFIQLAGWLFLLPQDNMKGMEMSRESEPAAAEVP